MCSVELWDVDRLVHVCVRQIKSSLRDNHSVTSMIAMRLQALRKTTDGGAGWTSTAFSHMHNHVPHFPSCSHTFASALDWILLHRFVVLYTPPGKDHFANIKYNLKQYLKYLSMLLSVNQTCWFVNCSKFEDTVTSLKHHASNRINSKIFRRIVEEEKRNYWL